MWNKSNVSECVQSRKCASIFELTSFIRRYTVFNVHWGEALPWSHARQHQSDGLLPGRCQGGGVWGKGRWQPERKADYITIHHQQNMRCFPYRSPWMCPSFPFFTYYLLFIFSFPHTCLSFPLLSLTTLCLLSSSSFLPCFSRLCSHPSYVPLPFLFRALAQFFFPSLPPFKFFTFICPLSLLLNTPLQCSLLPFLLSIYLSPPFLLIYFLSLPSLLPSLLYVLRLPLPVPLQPWRKSSQSSGWCILATVTIRPFSIRMKQIKFFGWRGERLWLEEVKGRGGVRKSNTHQLVLDIFWKMYVCT